VVLDFASLYPSVQEAKNLCWSTVNLGDVKPEHVAAGLVLEKIVTETGTFEFVQNVAGVFPQGLRTLKVERNRLKDIMKKFPYGSPEYQNADAAQRAIKIVMNSGYGTANCDYGIMPCRAVGTATCAVGRQLNQLADAFCQKTFGTETLYGDTDSIMIYFPEPEEVRAGTRKTRLEHARVMGARATREINEHLNKLFRKNVVKIEFEKIYFPFLSSGKKTYAGLKEEPVSGNLDKGCEMSSTQDGRLECKGLRNVRRDVPLFVQSMAERMLKALFYLHDEDELWNVVHTQAELIVENKLPVTEYVHTGELKSGYETKATTAQAAVSYAREYRHRGAGFDDGDRVPYVFVEEADPQRMERPPWLDADLVRAREVADRARVAKFGGTCAESVPVDSEEEEYDDGGTFERGAAASSGGVLDSVDDKKAKHARHPDELADTAPDGSAVNHIHIEHYVDCICAVLKQLMPTAKAGMAELRTFATLYKQLNHRRRGQSGMNRFVGTDGGRAPPTLSHRKPTEQQDMFARKLGSPTTAAVRVFTEKAKKPVVRKRGGAAPPPLPSLLSAFRKTAGAP